MLTENIIKNFKWLWLTIFLSIITLTFLFPLHERSEKLGIWIFGLTAIFFFLTWFLLGVFLFSNFSQKIIESMPENYRNKHGKWLIFLKFFTSKKIYEEIQISFNKSQNTGG